MDVIRRTETWRALSSALIVVGIVGLVLGADWGWWALIASGVAFLVELALGRLDRAG